MTTTVVRDKELSCQADEEHIRRLEEGRFEYSSEVARAAKKTADIFAGPVSDTADKGLERGNIVTYWAGRLLTKVPSCETILEEGK